MYRAPVTTGSLALAAAGGTIEAYDRGTGRTAWVYPQTPVEGGVEPHYCTRCVVEGQRVVAVFIRINGGWTHYGAAEVVCIDYPTGRVLWQQALDVKMNLGPNVGACTATVLVDSGQVLVSHANVVAAYALENGAMQWNRRFDAGLPNGRALGVALAVPGCAEQGSVS